MQTEMETVELKQTKGGKLNYSAGGMDACWRNKNVKLNKSRQEKFAFNASVIKNEAAVWSRVARGAVKVKRRFLGRRKVF